jgi:uncharacterized protein with PIN domain
MPDKITLEHSEQPPVCPHCHATLTEIAWHKIRGGPPMMAYTAVLSCPHCHKALGAMSG